MVIVIPDFNLWLKSLKNPDGTSRWGVSEINAIPIGGQAIQVAFGTHSTGPT